METAMRMFGRWWVARLLSASIALTTACGGSGDPATPTSPSTGDFFDSAGARLSYAIDRPAGSGPFPGVVIVHEGGAVQKSVYASLGASLAARGFMVLRYDKRGTGQSTGTFTGLAVANSTSLISTLAGDVAAAVRTLQAQSGI